MVQQAQTHVDLYTSGLSTKCAVSSVQSALGKIILKNGSYFWEGVVALHDGDMRSS